MTLRMGVLSAANIARKVVIPSILRADGVELVALGSSSELGRTFIVETDLTQRDGRPVRDSVRTCSYDELIAADDVDALYIALPNQLHAEWSKKAADAGKHVLCEKPATPTRTETEEMIEHCVGRGIVWMEAFMYRFHPQWAQIFERLGGGAIGELRTVRSVFTFTVRDTQNIRRRPETFGGSLYDVGVYCVNASRWLVGRAPLAVSGQMQLSPEGVDEEFQGLLDFGDGQTALISSSLSQPYRHEVELLGTEGRILIPDAFVNGSDDLWFEVEDATGARERVTVPGDDEYKLEVEDFAVCVRENRQPQVVSHADTIENAATLDALYASARTGARVAL